jgi:hypothetical protein
VHILVGSAPSGICPKETVYEFFTIRNVRIAKFKKSCQPGSSPPLRDNALLKAAAIALSDQLRKWRNLNRS